MAKPKLDWLQERAAALVSENGERNKAFDYYDNAENQDWELPDVLKGSPWVMKATEPMYAQAIQAGTNIVAGKRPNINIVPHDPKKKIAADGWEEALDIILAEVNQRRQTSIVEEMGHSIIKYGMSPVLVRYLKKEDGEKNGCILIDVYDARCVYPRTTAKGLQEVLLVEESVDIEDLRDVYGDEKMAKVDEEVSKINEVNKKQKSPLVHTVRKYEHLTKEWHSCWVEIGGIKGTIGGRAIEVSIEKWPHKFLPWSIRARGYESETRADAKYRSLLYNAWTSDEVDLANRVRSLRFSDSIRYAGAPRRVFQSDARETPDVDASSGEPTVRIKSDEALTQQEPWLPDPNMATLHAEIRQDHEKNTLSSVLLGGEIPSQAAFSTINLVTHSALGATKPFVDALQRQVADVLYIIMGFLYEMKEDYTASTRGPNDELQQFFIKHGEVNPKEMRIEVQIDASLPTDNQARATTAGALIDRGVISRKEARVELGYRNDTEIQKQILKEAFVEAFLQSEVKNILTVGDIQTLQQMRQQIMMEIQQQQEDQAAQAEAGQAAPLPEEGGGEGMPLPQEPTPETGIPPEANPNEGGPVPAQFNPGATFEGQTGETRSGETIV